MRKFLIIFLLWTSLVFADTSTVTVSTTSTSVVSADNTRQSLLIKNIGTTTCYITDESTAVSTTDFELEAGDVYKATLRDAKQAVNAITSSGSTELRIWEKNS